MHDYLDPDEAQPQSPRKDVQSLSSKFEKIVCPDGLI